MGGNKSALFLSLLILLLCCAWCEKPGVEKKKKLEEDVIGILRRKLESLQKRSLTNSDGKLKKEIELVKKQIQELQKYEKGEAGKKVDATLGEEPGVESAEEQPLSVEEAGDTQDEDRLDELEGVEDFEEENLEQSEQVEEAEVVEEAEEEAGDAEEEQPAEAEEDGSLLEEAPNSVERKAEGAIAEFEEADVEEGAEADEGVEADEGADADEASLGSFDLEGELIEEDLQESFDLEGEQEEEDLQEGFKSEEEANQGGQLPREIPPHGEEAVEPPLRGNKPSMEYVGNLHSDVGPTEGSANQISPPSVDEKGKEDGDKYKSASQDGGNSVGINNFGGCFQGGNSNGICPLDIFKKVLEDENFLQEFDSFIHNLYGSSKNNTPWGGDKMGNENLYMDLFTNALSFLNTIEVI